MAKSSGPVRTFTQATRNHTTPAKATSPTVSRGPVRTSERRPSSTPSRVQKSAKGGVSSAPRDARSL